MKTKILLFAIFLLIFVLAANEIYAQNPIKDKYQCGRQMFLKSKKIEARLKDITKNLEVIQTALDDLEKNGNAAIEQGVLNKQKELNHYGKRMVKEASAMKVPCEAINRNCELIRKRTKLLKEEGALLKKEQEILKEVVPKEENPQE